MGLKIGDIAPDFEGLNEKGQKICLSDFRGKKVVLFFYPKDMTLNCTIEACNLRDNYFDLQSRGIQVVGISADDGERHGEFSEKYGLPYPLIADTTKKIIRAYGVWGKKRFMGISFEGIKRMTFVIDESGRIEGVIGDVKSRTHSEQILGVINR